MMDSNKSLLWIKHFPRYKYYKAYNKNINIIEAEIPALVKLAEKN